jgi:hypothetical protein
VRTYLSFSLRHTAMFIVAASLTACGGGGGYGGGGGSNTPVAGVGPSKLFAADSTDRVVGSLANPDPSAGFLMVDRLVGPQAPYFYNYAGFTTNLGSLALDATRDILYVGNGTSVRIFYGASTANGDIFASASLGPIGNAGSLFVDTLNDRLYVGDDVTDVKVFSVASTATGTPTPRHVTGTTTPIHGIAADAAKNILYVSNDTVGGSTTHQIMVFDNADTVTTAGPNRTITPTASTVNLPVGGISLDAGNDRLYVAGGSGSATVMVFNTASTANGAIAPDKTFSGFGSGVVSAVVDPPNDRLYAVGSNGHIYLVEAVSTLNSGAVTAKDASLSSGSVLTAVAVIP